MIKNYKVLIIKLGAIGDIVMASAMLPALKKNYPECHITWLCGQGVYPLVSLFKEVDEIIAIDDSGLSQGAVRKASVVFEAWQKLAGRKFDLCFTAYHDKRYRWLSKTALAKERRYFEDRFAPVPGRYHGTEYARIVLGMDGNIPWEFPLADMEISPSPESQGMVLLLPGGARNRLDDGKLRRWPVENYRKLTITLLNEGYKVGLIGAEGDKWVLPYFEGLEVTSFIGETDLKGLLTLIAGAGAVIAHDSGPMHLAYLTGTPCVGLFGPVLAASRVPDKGLEFSLSGTPPCAPCYDGRHYAACEDNICMKEIGVSDVIIQLQKLPGTNIFKG